MKRLKILGFTAVLAFALTAFLGASMASAGAWYELHTESKPANWTGTPTSTNHELILPTAGLSFHNCANNFTSTTSDVEVINLPMVHQDSEGKTNLQCLDQSGAKATWSMGSCQFVLAEGAASAALSMNLTNCKGTPMSYTSGKCTVTIGEQQGADFVTYQNIGSGTGREIIATADITNLYYTNGTGCTNPGLHQDGRYIGAWNLSAKSGFGSPTGVWAVSPSSPTFFVFDIAPTSIAGTSTGNKVFGFEEENGGLTCESVSYSGTSSQRSSTTIAVVPTYHKCTRNIQGINYSIPDEYISTGGCVYEMAAFGGFSIGGASCATKPITITSPGCVITIGPTGSAGGLSFTNGGSGLSKTVTLGHATSTTGLTYTAAGAGCPSNGTFSSAVFRSTAVFSATHAMRAQ